MKPALIFDGDCAFCTQTANFVRRLNRRGQMDVVPWQSPGALARFGLTEQQCMTAVQFVDEQEKIFSAAAAANQTLRRLGGMWQLISLLYALPGIHQLEDAAYAWVARNRYRLPGGTPECKIDKTPANKT